MPGMLQNACFGGFGRHGRCESHVFYVQSAPCDAASQAFWTTGTAFQELQGAEFDDFGLRPRVKWPVQKCVFYLGKTATRVFSLGPPNFCHFLP